MVNHDDSIEPEQSVPKSGSAGKWLRATTAGCLATPAVLLVAIIGVGIWWAYSGQAAYEQALFEQAAKATETFSPALDKLQAESQEPA
ncbi:MAG: hypothetical protein ACI9MC_003341, partial [Kiritimatiellia bacterium]